MLMIPQLFEIKTELPVSNISVYDFIIMNYVAFESEGSSLLK